MTGVWTRVASLAPQSMQTAPGRYRRRCSPRSRSPAPPTARLPSICVPVMVMSSRLTSHSATEDKSAGLSDASLTRVTIHGHGL